MNALDSIQAWIANPKPSDPRDYVPQQREEAAASSRATAAAVAAAVAAENDPRLDTWNRAFQEVVEWSIRLEEATAHNRGRTLRGVDIIEYSSQVAWDTVPGTGNVLLLALGVLRTGLLAREDRETWEAIWPSWPEPTRVDAIPVSIPRPYTGPVIRPPSTDWVEEYEEAANAVLLSKGRPDVRWVRRMYSFMRDHAVPQGPWSYNLALQVLRHCARHAPRGTI